MSLVNESLQLPKSSMDLMTLPETSTSSFNEMWMKADAIDETMQHHIKSSTFDKEMSSDLFDKSAYTCTECGIVYSTAADLESHERTHVQGPTKYDCLLCHTNYVSRENLRMHMESSHGHEYKFFCFECGRGFKSYPSQNNHDRLFHRSDTVCPVCDICGKIFPFESKLQAHMKKHSQDRPYVCPVCGKSYKHHQNLKDHVSICPYNQQAKDNS